MGIDVSAGKSSIPGPPLAAVAAAFLCVLLRPDLVDLGGGEFELDYDAPQRISSHILPFQEIQPLGQSRALRGCCGQPRDFRWILPEGAAVGEIVRTRVVALDNNGRPAQSAACSQLRVNVSLSGSARIANTSSLMIWQSGEIQLDIENNVAEVVEAEVRIEGQSPGADALLYTSRIKFVAVKPELLKLYLQPVGAGRPATFKREGKRTHVWPVRMMLEAVVIAEDRFGNRVSLADMAKHLDVHTNSKHFKVKSLFKLDSDGEVRARVLAEQAGPVEVWVQHDGVGEDAARWRGIGVNSMRHLDFVGPASKAPVSWAKGTAKELSAADEAWQPAAQEVREAFLHAWRGYRTFAWGADELKPLSKVGHDTYGQIGMTILDSLTSLWLMGLTEEFEEATEFVKWELDFQKANREVSVFELVIRALGGLLGAYSLSGRSVFLERATDLANRLLPAYNTSSGLPYPRWDIALGRGTPSRDPTILSEAGSIQLEFRYLSAVTGDLQYRKAAERTFQAVQSTGEFGLRPVHMTPPDQVPPMAVSSPVAVGALADSYYEYLLKQWVQSPSEERYKDLWLKFMDELPQLVRPLADEKERGSMESARLVELKPNKKIMWKTEHLSCFIPGMIALGITTLPEKDLDHGGRNATWNGFAESLTVGCAELWTSTRSGLAPEFAHVTPRAPYNVAEISEHGKHSFLRPETAESLFYLFRLTGNEQYRVMGRKIFDALVANAKVDAGFATVQDVRQVPTRKVDEMHSFVLAETLKYLYLLFSPADALDLDRYVLNTEGHPLMKFGPW
mmetsp:Transcript_30342/g.66417  ORF Transcript_30342/g.66417 Transcript_30342/m.66417 type:complete len:793 (-) Transcript_30342:91-2469(-)